MIVPGEMSKMNNEIFRQKSIDKVKSPEKLDEYIQVSNPSIWLLLVSIVVLLAGACVWGVFGHVDSTVKTSVLAEGETVVCYIAEEDELSVQTGMIVEFDDFEAVITEVDQDGSSCVCVLRSERTIPDGSYEGKVVVDRIRPLSFILN